MNLFVWPGSPGATKVADENGFALAEWHEDGLNFAAVSDIPPDELRQFKDLYSSRAGLGPPK